MATHATPAGIPWIGRNRELKRVLENYWRSPATDGLLAAAAHNTASSYIGAALKTGVDSVLTTGRSFCDSMPDASALFGVLPACFQDIPRTDGPNLLEWINRYFATARGTKT